MSPELQAIAAGLVRHALTTFGGYLVSTGVIHSDQVNGGVGAAMVLIGIAWSWWQKKGQAAAAAELQRIRNAPKKP